MFTTMCPKEQQTSDNLIVKDYCFIIEIADKFSFSGILKADFLSSQKLLATILFQKESVK